MSRIATNLSGIERTLLNRMAEANAAAAVSTLRLATMQKINAPKDDPAAFVTLSRFQSQLSNVTAAMSNVTAASGTLTQTETLAGQIQDQITLIRDELLTPTSSSQANIDTALAEINRLATTQVNGRRMLDGSADYLVSNANATQVRRVTVYASPGQGQSISGSVTSAATQATLRYTGSGGVTTSGATITLTGNLGNAQLTVTSGESLATLADAVNAVSYQTGVTASVDGDNLDFSSVGYGDAAKVSIAVVPASGTFVEGTDYGTSGVAEINGTQYQGTSGDGNLYQVNQGGFRFEIQFQPGFSGAFTSISVSGAALGFALSPELGSPATLALPSMLTAQLGGYSGRLDQIGTGGAASGLGDHTAQALRIVDEASGQVARVQGYIGGFSRASVESASSMLADLQEDLQDSIDSIDLVDEAAETERLVFYNALASNAISGLAVINQQRATIVDMIKHIAGLG